MLPKRRVVARSERKPEAEVFGDIQQEQLQKKLKTIQRLNKTQIRRNNFRQLFYSEVRKADHNIGEAYVKGITSLLRKKQDLPVPPTASTVDQRSR